MKVFSLSQLLLASFFGSLAVSASQQRLAGDIDEEDDTPLPLVIWHG